MSAISLISKASTAPPVQLSLGVIPGPVIRAIYGTVFLAQRNLSGQLAASSNKLRHWLHDRRLLLLSEPWPWQSQIFISTQIYPTQLSFCLTQPVAHQSLLFSFCGWSYNWRTFYIWKPPWTFTLIYPIWRSLSMLQTKPVLVFGRNVQIWYGFNSQFSKYRYTSTSSVFSLPFSDSILTHAPL